jgi:fructose-1-phosphate kinase PfkB-like protein
LIVTLTVNPALDRTLSVDRLAFENRAYIESGTNRLADAALTPLA